MQFSQFQMPQAQGSFYVLNNSQEISSVPASQMISAAFCPSENLLYLKSMQNGQPTFLLFQTTPYNPPKPEEFGKELMEELRRVNERLDKLEKKGGSLNELV